MGDVEADLPYAYNLVGCPANYENYDNNYSHLQRANFGFSQKW